MKKAFTLVELLVVIAIIGLIASISIIALSNARAKSRDSKRVADIKQIQNALELFFSDQGRYSTVTEWNSGSLYATGTFGTTTYLEKLPNDPNTRNPYVYASTDNGGDYNLIFNIENSVGAYNNSGVYSASASAVKYQGPSDGLVAWWCFNKGSGTSIYDYSGLGHEALFSTAPVSSAPTWISSNQCLYGKTCLFFDGQDDGLYISSGRDDFNAGTGDYTIMAWVKFSSLANNQRLFAKDNDDNRFSLWKYDDNGRFFFDYSAFNNNQISIGTGTTYQDQWIFLLGTVSRSQTLAEIYINGIRNNYENIVFSNNWIGTGCATIGHYGWECNTTTFSRHFFHGYLQDLRVYKRHFSSSEVLALYNNTKP